MMSWLTNAWRVPELRKRVLFTAMIIGLYRLGSWMPAPGVDSEQIKSYFSGQSGTVLGLLNLFSGGALSQFSLFALGIMPYVTASIIIQLLTVVIPSLERLQKEGEAGYAKINQYTRYSTVALAALPVAGLRVPVQAAERAPGRYGPHRADRNHAHSGHDDADVDGRADHEARRRQRHLDHHLLLDHRGRSDDDPLVDQRRADGEALLPDPLPRGHGRRRLHPGGPAPDSGAVRAPRCRSPRHVGRIDLHAAPREHGRRDPNHLRSCGARVPADDRAVLPTDAGLHQQLVHAERLPVPDARGVPDHHLHVLLHRGPVQPDRSGGQSPQARRLHSGHTAGPADGAVPRPRAHAG